METTKNQAPDSQGRSGFWRFYDWANEKLYPILGPADLSPYEGSLQQVATALCPLCGSPMNEHFFDRSSSDVVLYCPTAELEHDEASHLDGFGRKK